MKCSEIKVIKKDGTKEEFNVQKVLAAVNKSANRAMIIFSKAESKFICEFVEETELNLYSHPWNPCSISFSRSFQATSCATSSESPRLLYLFR